MENSLDLFKSWVFNAAKNEKIFISQLTWPLRLGLNINDYIVQVRVGDTEFIGHGSDSDPDLAILKAVAEAYERFCVTSLKIKNSIGCAVHTDIKLAEEHALLELIERDCFLVNFIDRRSFKEIDRLFYNVSFDKPYKMTNYLLASDVLKVTLTRITINGVANVLGLGISETLDKALAKSEIEALRQWVYVVDKGLIADVNYEDISDKKKLSFDDHGNIALTQKHTEEIEFIFDQNSATEAKDFAFFDSTVTEYVEHKLTLEKTNPFYGVPLFFVKAQNPNAQELFVGKTIDNLNPLRIPNTGKLNLCLHPFR